MLASSQAQTAGGRRASRSTTGTTAEAALDAQFSWLRDAGDRTSRRRWRSLLDSSTALIGTASVRAIFAEARRCNNHQARARMANSQCARFSSGQPLGPATPAIIGPLDSFEKGGIFSPARNNAVMAGRRPLHSSERNAYERIAVSPRYLISFCGNSRVKG